MLTRAIDHPERYRPAFLERFAVVEVVPFGKRVVSATLGVLPGAGIEAEAGGIEAATYASSAESFPGKRGQAEDHRYSSARIKSPMILSSTPRALALRLIHSNWCLAQSTRAA